MTAIKKNDFVELEYTGRIQEDNSIFDTTVEAVAKENKIYKKGEKYSPIIVCIGKHMMMPSLEEALIGKEIGKSYEVKLEAERAFGKKDGKLIQMIPTNKFLQQKINPIPGLSLNIDGNFGVIKTVSGGRCLVDFNHPLSGKDVVYSVKVNKIVSDSKEKLNSLANLYLGHAHVEVNGDIGTVKIHQKLPKELEDEFNKEVTSVIPELKSVSFSVEAHTKE
ncbi:MAG TPA: peptidylprolyl isomerase [Candidatus Nanoarchaeia archaeon]|nr:peptidylprolyl isomerase [Candidatus Nanoarchaeia archaeon]